MGQKVNSNIFRLGYKNNYWNSLYSSKNYNEFSLLVFQDLEIKNFIYRFFKKSFILIKEYKINRSYNSIYIYISYFSTSKSLLDNDKLIKGLAYFTKNKVTINIIIRNIIDSVLKNFFLSEFLLKVLRKYKNKIEFFDEFMYIFIILSKKKKSSNLLVMLISIQLISLKRHNFFFNFLKRSFIFLLYSEFSNINGIKLVIKGRLNGKPRSNNKIIQIGKIPLQTLDSKVEYSECTSFTKYGTFGIKVWICEK